MGRLLIVLCTVTINVLVQVVYVDAISASFFHDYVKDGRLVDGPFPASLKNVPYYCYQVPDKGPCERMFVVYFYDVVRRMCMPMLYSGCGGNENRFESKASCRTHCESNRRI